MLHRQPGYTALIWEPVTVPKKEKLLCYAQVTTRFIQFVEFNRRSWALLSHLDCSGERLLSGLLTLSLDGLSEYFRPNSDLEIF